uniref:non-specific serine/threonine protein kinase n=1 Tax=Anabas testudineus TaxID=64144 RepID=A0A7N6FEC5_ANATE
MDSVSARGGKMVESDEQPERAAAAAAAAAGGGGGGAAMAALHQCELIQNMIDISISSLQGLRTKCAASNDLTQQEIRTLEVKLMKYICKQLQCKQKVPETERPEALDSYPRLRDWLRTINLRPELTEVVETKLSLDALLQMTGAQVRDTMRRLGSSSEECARLSAALSCLKRAPLRPHSPSPLALASYISGESPHTDPFPMSLARTARLHGHTSTPPITPPSKRRHRLKPPCTPPPPSRKVLHLLPNIALTRSKSHESQLGNPVHRNSPQAVRRDIGLAVTHRFSTRSWLSQTCQVCQKNMMFGVKCKHCRLKCHNKCTKEAPSCRISFIPIAKIRRTESVPSDINNPVDRPPEAPQFGTLPKAITKKDHPPVLNQLDSSSNPSSTTSSTPSSPAPFQQSNPPSATPPPNPSPKGHRDSRFNFPGELGECALYSIDEGDDEGDGEIRMNMGSDGELEGDELDDLPSSRRNQWKGPISRKASQTSVYLQEWDIPFEQLDLGELIGKGRWGKVHKGRWHGEVAIRLLEIDGNNQDHLKLFKKEVMNYRQTRHENVVLFMGACMAPPHLAIITSFCKGRTLYSVVRDTKNTLDINKTRQIAQEIVKGMGYLHAKGIVHKDLKSKNVFHDTNKVVITDFGLFGISGVVQEGRRENKLKLPHGWICYLAPEIVRKMSPGNNEDRLPFSTAADVYAFGTIWYELQARDWPITNQPVEATIWQVGSGEGIKKVLTEISLGKEVTEILSACWAYDLRDRPTFTLLADMLEKLPKLNRRLSHPGHFWKSAE